MNDETLFKTLEELPPFFNMVADVLKDATDGQLTMEKYESGIKNAYMTVKKLELSGSEHAKLIAVKVREIIAAIKRLSERPGRRKSLKLSNEILRKMHIIRELTIDILDVREVVENGL